VSEINNAEIEKALNDPNPRIVLDEDSGSVISEDALQLIRDSGKAIEIELENGLVITIDPDKITDNARAIDLNINVEITSQGNQIQGIPANSIALFPAAQGDFGFEMSFTFSAAQLTQAGLNGNNARLFHVAYNGTVTEKGRITRNTNGSLTITLDSASHYVISNTNMMSSGSGSG
jgi:hypothetical protein